MSKSDPKDLALAERIIRILEILEPYWVPVMIGTWCGAGLFVWIIWLKVFRGTESTSLSLALPVIWVVVILVALVALPEMADRGKRWRTFTFALPALLMLVAQPMLIMQREARISSAEGSAVGTIVDVNHSRRRYSVRAEFRAGTQTFRTGWISLGNRSPGWEGLPITVRYYAPDPRIATVSGEVMPLSNLP